jgi:PAS domain S-box-containing protein
MRLESSPFFDDAIGSESQKELMNALTPRKIAQHRPRTQLGAARVEGAILVHSAGNQSPIAVTELSPQAAGRSWAPFLRERLNSLQTYLFAVGTSMAALGLRLALAGQLRGRSTLIVFTLPIMFSGYVGGLGAGLLATAISCVGACYFLLPPFYSLRVESTVDRWDLFLLALGGVVISALNEALHRARRRAAVVTVELRAREAQAGDALRRSETQLQTIVESITEAVVVSDLNGKLLHFNQAALDMLGYASREEGRRDFSQLADTFELSGLDGAQWSVDQWPMARILRGERLHELEARMRRFGAEWEHVYSFGGTIARDTGGRPVMAVVTFSDITQRRRAESAALRLAAIVESSVDAVIGKDLNSIVTSWNAAAEMMFGYSAAEMVGQPITLIIPADHQSDEEQILSAIKRGERVEHFETERLRKDGGLVSISVTVSPIKDSHGRVIGASKVARDITARKRAEARFRRLVDSNVQGVMFWNAKGAITDANDAFLRIVGYSRDDLTAGRLDWKKLSPPEYADLDRRAMDELVSTGVCTQLEKEYFRPDGSRVPVLVGAACFEDDANEGVCFVLDLTEKKRADETSFKAGALQRAIFNSANFSSIATDAKGVIQIFNVGAERMLGYTAADVMNKITPADISDPLEVIARAKALSIEHGTPITPGFEALVFKASRGIEDIYELTYVRKDRSRFPAVVSVTALRDAQDAIIGYLLIGTDNTARKQAEEALLKAGALQRAMFSSANFSCIATDAKGVIQVFNVGAERMLGYTAAEVVNKITPAELHDPQEVIARAAALSLESGTSIAPGFEALVFKAARGIEDIYELTKIRKDGSRFPAVVSVTALRDAQDAIIGYLLIGTDNTARKQAEEALLKAGALQRAIFNSANFSSIATDAKGVIQIFNVGAERMLGYTAAEVMNKITPADISDPQELIARARALSLELGTRIAPGFEALVFKASRGIEDIYELNYIRKDGSRFPAVVSVTALRDAHEAIIGYLLIGTDNTARTRAEDARRMSEARIAGIVNSAMDAVISVNSEQHIVLFNAAAEKIFCRTAESALGQHIDELVPERFRLNYHSYVEDFGKSGLTSRSMRSLGDLSALRPDGTEFPIEASISQVEFAGERVFTVILRDITERKLAAEALHVLSLDLEHRVVERTAQLQTANNELESFSYSVSHDLRAPLRSIDGFSMALMEDCAEHLNAEGQDSLKRIRAASQRMGHLIDDLLNMSRLTRVVMNRETVDLSRMAREVIDELRAGDPERHVDCSIAERLSAHGDASLLRVVLTNLLANAWKFTSKGSDSRIEFGSADDNGIKAFFVRDNGAGFDMAYASKLFGAFQRMHAVQEFPGTGIGLATVQRIVQRHGGRIWAESTVGAGATFHFTL